MPGRLGSMPTKLAPMPKRAESFYQSPEWEATKRAKRAQGPAFCRVCGSTKRLILDHIVERKDGGADFDLSNLEWLCTPHHNAKTARARAARASGVVGEGGGQKSGGRRAS